MTIDICKKIFCICIYYLCILIKTLIQYLILIKFKKITINIVLLTLSCLKTLFRLLSLYHGIFGQFLYCLAYTVLVSVFKSNSISRKRVLTSFKILVLSSESLLIYFRMAKNRLILENNALRAFMQHDFNIHFT
jgi:hypothetical protein